MKVLPIYQWLTWLLSGPGPYTFDWNWHYHYWWYVLVAILGLQMYLSAGCHTLACIPSAQVGPYHGWCLAHQIRNKVWHKRVYSWCLGDLLAVINCFEYSCTTHHSILLDKSATLVLFWLDVNDFCVWTHKAKKQNCSPQPLELLIIYIGHIDSNITLYYYYDSTVFCFCYSKCMHALRDKLNDYCLEKMPESLADDSNLSFSSVTAHSFPSAQERK